MRKSQMWIGVALLGVFAAVLVILFQVASEPELPEAPSRAVVEEPPEVESPVIESASSAREVAAAAPVETPNEGPPPAYAKHLGGVIGRIVDTDGTPVPGMRLDALTITIEELFPQLDSMFAETPIDFQEVKATARTQDDGTFRFDKLEPRAVYVLGIDPNGPRATIRMIDKPPNAGEVVDLGDIKLDAYVIFTGRVADEQGSPIAGARIRASNLPSIVFNFGVQDLKPGFSVAFQEEFRGSEDWRVARVPSWAFRLLEKVPFPTTASAEDGTFRLEGVPVGQVTLLVDQPDFVSLTKGPIPSGNSGEKNVGTCTLTAGETLVGTVVDGSGLPIADAEVLAGPIQDLAPVALMVPAGKTDAEGRFTAKGMRDSDHAVAARSKTGVEWTLVRDVMPGYDEPQIVLANTYQVEVRAFASTGEQISKPQLVVQKINELPLHPLLVPPIPLAGRLSYTEDGAAIVGDLAAGKYSILVRGPGHAAAQVEADLTEGSSQVVAQLEAEFTTKVTVVAKGSGEPIHWATVGLFSDDRSRERRDTRAIPLANKRTDERGEAAINGLEKGKYKLIVLHPAYAETFADVEVPGAEVRVELPEGGSVRGRVHEAGEPPVPDRFIGMAKIGEGFPRFNVTGEDGEFRITHLSPGDYTVAVVRRFANQGIGELAGSAQNMIPERFVPVTIVEGEEAVVDIDLKGLDSDLPTARLSGRVTMNGGPAANMGLRYNATAPQSSGNDEGGRRRGPGDFMQRMKNTVTDETGFFDFGEVVAGDGRIDVSQPGEASQFNFGRVTRVTVKLEPNETENIVIDLKVGRVRGRVVDARTGQPLATAEVGLRPTEKKDDNAVASPFGDWNADVRMDTATDRDGAFAFEYVPAGDYELSVRRNDYAPQRVRGIVVPVNGQPPAVDVRLQTGVIAKGKVVVPPPAEGEQASNRRWAFINFRGQDEATGNGGARVDTETMEFEVDDLMPGRYQVTCWMGGDNLAPVEVVIPEQGAENLVLTFEKAKPPEPQKPAGG
jgi:uncharacterized protein (DUF2141 family)